MTQGNPLCWQDGLWDYETCCGEGSHNLLGNPACWEAPRSFQTCCLAASYEPSCWVEARRSLRTQKLIPNLAQEELLASDLSLSQFCCHPGDFTSEVCWAGQGYAEEFPGGPRLNFTHRYVQCCFPRLQAALKEAAPSWMTEQIARDLRPWREKRLTEAVPNGDHRFCRFRINASGVWHCNITSMSHWLLVETLRDAFHVLRLLAPLPELDFVVSQEESYCVNDLPLELPVLAQAQPEGCPGVLMPWWAFLQQDWTRRYTEKLSRAHVPWSRKASKLFWRGSDTICLRPKSKGPCSSFSSESWMDFPRSRLVLWSKLLPQLVDAKFTKDVVHPLLRNFTGAQLLVNEIVPPEKHVDYKFLMYVDGASLSDRLFWILQTQSAVFRAASPLRVWLDAALLPGEHYVPVAEDLGDLARQLRWAEEEDLAGRLHDMALRAAHLAGTNLSLDANLLYLYHLLMNLKEVLPRPAPGQPAAPAAASRQELRRQRQMNARSYLTHALDMLSQQATPRLKLDCWTSGFSKDLCCDLTHGPEGLLACWDQEYTFARCC